MHFNENCCICRWWNAVCSLTTIAAHMNTTHNRNIQLLTGHRRCYRIWKKEKKRREMILNSEISVWLNSPTHAPSGIGRLSVRNHSTCGVGWPIAEQRKRNGWPSTTINGPVTPAALLLKCCGDWKKNSKFNYILHQQETANRIIQGNPYKRKLNLSIWCSKLNSIVSKILVSIYMRSQVWWQIRLFYRCHSPAN